MLANLGIIPGRDSFFHPVPDPGTGGREARPYKPVLAGMMGKYWVLLRAILKYRMLQYPGMHRLALGFIPFHILGIHFTKLDGQS